MRKHDKTLQNKMKNPSVIFLHQRVLEYFIISSFLSAFVLVFVLVVVVLPPTIAACNLLFVLCCQVKVFQMLQTQPICLFSARLLFRYKLWIK